MGFLYVSFEVPVIQLVEDFDIAYINGVRGTDENNDGELEAFAMEMINVHGGNADGSAKTLRQTIHTSSIISLKIRQKWASPFMMQKDIGSVLSK